LFWPRTLTHRALRDEYMMSPISEQTLYESLYLKEQKEYRINLLSYLDFLL